MLDETGALHHDPATCSLGADDCVSKGRQSLVKALRALDDGRIYELVYGPGLLFSPVATFHDTFMSLSLY